MALILAAAVPIEGGERGWATKNYSEAGRAIPTRGSLLRSGGRFAGPEHDDFRADRRAVVEIDDVLVRQADAARRDVGANGPGFIGAASLARKAVKSPHAACPAGNSKAGDRYFPRNTCGRPNLARLRTD